MQDRNVPDTCPYLRQGICINDIGIVVLPDGSHFSLAVFVFDAACSPERCEEIIAGIAGAVYARAEGAI